VRYKAASLAVALALMSTAASAQGYYYGPARPMARVSPQQAAIAVRAAGFRAVAPPVWRGRFYVVPSVDRYGRMNRVFVDADFGEVVRARPMLAAGYPRPPGAVPMRPSVRPAPMDDDDVVDAPMRRGAPGPVASMPPYIERGANATTGAIGNSDELPPPPSRAAPRKSKPATASVHPTPPRNVPGVKAKKDTKNAAVPTSPTTGNAGAPAADAPPSTTPRVVLPGGPPVKEEPKTAASGASPALAGETPPAPAVAPNASNPAIPAMQGLE
jgi:hypothetical protein